MFYLSVYDNADFWKVLRVCLEKLGIPMALRSCSMADVGWGRGHRILITNDGRITTPSGGLVWMGKVNPELYSKQISDAYKLTRREKAVLKVLRDGGACVGYSHGRTVCTVPKKKGGVRKWHRRTTVERLSLLGLVTERIEVSNDVIYVAVDPKPVA